MIRFDPSSLPSTRSLHNKEFKHRMATLALQDRLNKLFFSSRFTARLFDLESDALMLRKPKASATVNPTNDPALPAAPQPALQQEQCKTCPKQLVSSRSKTLTIATHEVCKEHITACPMTYQLPKPEEEESDETEEAASREPAPVELSRKRKTSAVLESEKRAKLPKKSAARKELAATIAATVTGARRHANLASSPSTPTQTETIVIPSSPDSDALLSPPNPQPRMPSGAQEPPSSLSPTPSSSSFPSFSPSPTCSNSTPIPESDPADPMAWMDEESINALVGRGFFLVFGIHIQDLLRSCDYHQGCGSYWRRNFADYHDVYFEHSTTNSWHSWHEIGSFVKVLVELNNPGEVCMVGWIAERCKDAFLARYGEDDYHQLFAVGHTVFTDARLAGVEA
ncbi:hypothetical protein BCR44DRAFT_78361 [Catenaria anguillulae PL171]|uniref:Uncharacterized protein n=1 Tax=Catenaria anguillulae PL171 TaxID=765915 RepID=A0A1Y2HEL2_9FUNG|nr:hypothetical protein BCR44DRAFT_78361 [Catenaria anguillulae PL171]